MLTRSSREQGVLTSGSHEQAAVSVLTGGYESYEQILDARSDGGASIDRYGTSRSEKDTRQ